MELITLSMRNFRQFYGQQELDFSQDDERNVTVIHGSNGAGKSTILNAFLWLFYEEITLPQADRVASERAMAEAARNDTVSVEVELEFAHEGRRYWARRHVDYRKDSADDLRGTQVDMDVQVELIDADGNRETRSNPETSLKQILPERLRDLFFFDGETIDELTQVGSQDRIRQSIRNIMGLEILERAIRHLDYVEGQFEDEMEAHGSDELSDLVSRKQELTSELNAAEDRLEETKESRSLTEDELLEVEQRLSELEDSKDLQKRRDELREERETVQEKIEDINDQLRQVISDSGHLVFAMSAIEETGEMLREKRQKGEIPSEIKTTFVEDLLELEECICGRHLRPDSEARDSVAQWRERAGSSELEEAAMTIASRLGDLGNEQEEMFEHIEDLLSKRTERSDRLNQINGELDDISDKLTDKETEDVRELEQRREQLEDRVEELTVEIGKIEGRIENLEDDIDDVEDEISEAREENEKANLANRRRLATQRLHEQLEGLFEKYQNDVRERVNDRVNDIFREIIAKDYYAEIDEEYSLRILKDVGDREAVSVAKSTGERQVASLSFIASLISLAKERYESEKDATYFTGGIYPIIMDSPFGYLDPTYQQKVSEIIPEMSDQVVVLVTHAQWSDAVEGEMDAITGKKYSLEYYNPTEDNVDYEYTVIEQEGI